MKIVVAAFYADIEGRPSRFEEYKNYIKSSRLALERTNPKARYVILTNPMTAPKIEPFAEIEVLAENDRPLMVNIIRSQIRFVEKTNADLICLPDVDCLSNKDLKDSIPENVGMAITHKGWKFHYKINNMAYIRDSELGVWFLKKALGILESWPEEKHHWWGDQEAWQSALGVEIGGLGYWTVVERIDKEKEILVARPERRMIHLYPCTTHNCPTASPGELREAQANAYFVHFKGPRKEHIKEWMRVKFGVEI